jgi:hypothetical protein
VIWAILKYVGIAIACVVIVVVSSALLYRKYLQHRVAEARAITSLNGIDSLEAVQIGGIQQWIEVRGQNVNNPILLFIHGGPGIAFIPMASSFQDPWETYFTVVQWDQRGAGKTYETNELSALGTEAFSAACGRGIAMNPGSVLAGDQHAPSGPVETLTGDAVSA